MLATVESSYGCDAEFYDRRTGAFQRDRLRIIDALPLRVGDVVLDVDDTVVTFDNPLDQEIQQRLGQQR